MPAENKYEIRSQEVQEVLSTPPRFLTLWGNMIVIGVLIAGLIFLGRYEVMQKIKLPVQLTEANGKLALIVDADAAGQLKVNQPLKLHTGDDQIVKDKIIAILDTIIGTRPNKTLILSLPSSNQLPIQPVANANAEIETGRSSLFHLFLSR